MSLLNVIYERSSGVLCLHERKALHLLSSESDGSVCKDILALSKGSRNLQMKYKDQKYK